MLLTAALYVRVSTLDQNDGMQRTELHEYCRRMGWSVIEYAEKKSSVRKRPAYDQLMADARQRKFDVVLVFMLDRWARSLKYLLNSIGALNSSGIRFICPRQGIGARPLLAARERRDELGPVGRASAIRPLSDRVPLVRRDWFGA